jgi:class 3 adenylate cyclase/tetratricopeptide (TPR) repeat protein
VSRKVRKVVTVLFADLVGSTSLGERLDPEQLEHVKTRFFEEAQGAIERRGGTVEKFVGDAVMAVFGIPQAHEDDPLRAARAAEELSAALVGLREELAIELEARLGIDTGEVLAGDPTSGQAFVTGDVVNVAARLQEAATPGQIFIGPGMHARTSWAVDSEPVAPLELKGKSLPIPAWRLHAVLPDAEAIPRRLDLPLVGRTRELGALQNAFGEATSGALRLLTLVGEPGIGKSRLAEELLREVRSQATILTGRCLPYGEGITYWPLVEILREASHHEARAAIVDLLEGEPERELIAERLATAVGSSDAPGSSDEIAWAARKLFERLARERPLVVRLEDLQWAEPTFLDLVEHVTYLSAGTPILLLCEARPELLEMRPSWPGTKLDLEPLATEESHALAAQVSRSRRLDPELLERICERSEGNPLFLEQLAGTADEEAALPPTLEALLMARLDRLNEAPRRAIEYAAVVGQEFWASALRELAPEGTELGSALLELIRGQLVLPEQSTLPGQDAFRFAHLLIRDAAYAGIPKQVRTELHERLASWLERLDEQRGVEHTEIVAFHLEQACRYRAELGRIDVDRAHRAAELLLAAGRRAITRGDYSAARNLLERGAALLPPGTPPRAVTLFELGRLIWPLAGAQEALRVLEQAVEEAAASGDQAVELAGEIEVAFLREGIIADVSTDFVAVAHEKLPALEATGDHRLLAATYDRLGIALVNHGLAEAANEAWQRSLEHARAAGDRDREQRTLSRFGLVYELGPTPIDEGIRRLEQLLAEVEPSHAPRASLLAHLAWLFAARGELDRARELDRESQAINEELGVAANVLNAGSIELLAGDPAVAAETLRRAYDHVQDSGEVGGIALAASLLAEALRRQGDSDEARRLADQAGEVGHPHDLEAQVAWRSVKAKILAGQGLLEQAERLAREAISIVDETDMLRPQAMALLDLALVLRSGRQFDEARVVAEQALGRFQAKGDVVSARRTQELLEELTAEPLPE